MICRHIAYLCRMAYTRIYNRHTAILKYITANSRPTTKDIKNYLNQLGEVVDERTILRDILSIEVEFGYEFTRKGIHPNKWYHIESEPDDKSLVFKYMEQAHLADMFKSEVKHGKDNRKAVFLEDIELSNGLEHLKSLLSAIRGNHKVLMHHQKFGAETTIRKVCPLFIKQFRHRYYLIAREDETGKTKSFGLERIVMIERLEESFTFRKEDDHDSMFSHVIGLFDNEKDPIRIRIWSKPGHIGYLRSVKIHSSQVEIGESDGGALFEFEVVPNYEFFQTILMMESNVKIVSPESVVERMKTMLNGILENY